MSGFAFSKSLMKCIRYDYIGAVQRLFDVLTTMTANSEYMEAFNKRLNPGKETTSYTASAVMLRTRLTQNLTEGHFELSYDSILEAARQNINWFPLVQAFYDLRDTKQSITRSTDVPEPILIQGLFDLVWNGRIDYVSPTEYDGVAPEALKDIVATYINEHTKCEEDPRQNGYPINANFTTVPDNAPVGTRVLLNVLDFEGFSSNPGNPANVFNARLMRQYLRHKKKPPSITTLKATITKAPKIDYETALLFEDTAPLVTINIDGDETPYQYSTTQLYLDPEPEVGKRSASSKIVGGPIRPSTAHRKSRLPNNLYKGESDSQQHKRKGGKRITKRRNRKNKNKKH